MQSYKEQLDSFKSFLGLSPDSIIELDPDELIYLTRPTKQIIDKIAEEEKPAISINLEELETRIRENAEEIKKAEEIDKKEQKTGFSDTGERMKQNIDKIKTKKG